jgi:hypothetical protein
MVVLTQEEGDDPSANARISESISILPYIAKNWLLGNGDISNRWNGGYERIIGYFFPADVGIIGAMFIYGLIGNIFCYIQVIFLLKRTPTITDNNANVIWIAAQGIVVILLLQSLIKGNIVLTPTFTLFFLAIMDYVYRMSNLRKEQIDDQYSRNHVY